jgi:CubicO group peptidase (beta-lactamase class C family)
MTVAMDELGTMLSGHVGRDGVPGAVALIARGNQVQTAAVGLADVEHNVPAARDSIFRLASITKPIVAAAVMQLIDEGRIGLDDPVGDWLPELAPRTDPSRTPCPRAGRPPCGSC